MRFLCILVLVLLLLISAVYGGDPFYSDLVVHYTDFSYINSIATGFNNVYFGTSRGVIQYNLAKGGWIEPLTGKTGLSLNSVYEVVGSFDDSFVWAKTSDGIMEYNSTLDRWDMVDEIPSAERRGRHIRVDDNYFAPRGYRYLQGGALADDWNRTFQFTDIYEDGLENEWIGTWGLGVCKAEVADRRIVIMPCGLLQEDVHTMMYDEGKLWLTGLIENAFRTGITVFDPKYNEYDYLETEGSLISDPLDINDFCANEKEAFVATDNSVWVVDKKNLEFIDQFNIGFGTEQDRINCIEANGDRLFIGTDYGLEIMSIYPDSSELISKLLLKEYFVTCLKRTEKALWIGTDHGVFRYTFKNGKLEELDVKEASFGNYIFDIDLGNNTIWISYQTGLSSIDLKTAEVNVYPEVLKYGDLYHISVSDTILAGATDNGMLLLYNGKEKHTQLYTINDGLLSNYLNDLLFVDDYLWLASDYGLTRFWYKNPRIF